MNVVVRSQSSPELALSAVRQEIWRLDPGLPISDVQTMGDRTAALIAQPRFSMVLLTLFASIATLLAAVGLYAVMAYSVSQRRHELGVRMALGAEPRAVLGLVVGHGMRVAAIGVAVLLLSVAFLASYLPARRAARLDPVVALRPE